MSVGFAGEELRSSTFRGESSSGGNVSFPESPIVDVVGVEKEECVEDGRIETGADFLDGRRTKRSCSSSLDAFSKNFNSC